MSDIVPFKPREYTATSFRCSSIYGEFVASGTLCGNVDFVVPQTGFVLNLSIDEIDHLIEILNMARKDVVENSNPYGDPRILD